jgi:hypothetical protein
MTYVRMFLNLDAKNGPVKTKKTWNAPEGMPYAVVLSASPWAMPLTINLPKLAKPV